MDALDVRELGERFDVVLCLGILHRVTDPIVLLQTLADVLMPGGEVVLETYGSQLSGRHPGDRGSRAWRCVPARQLPLLGLSRRGSASAGAHRRPRRRRRSSTSPRSTAIRGSSPHCDPATDRIPEQRMGAADEARWQPRGQRRRPLRGDPLVPAGRHPLLTPKRWARVVALTAAVTVRTQPPPRGACSDAPARQRHRRVGCCPRQTRRPSAAALTLQKRGRLPSSR